MFHECVQGCLKTGSVTGSSWVIKKMLQECFKSTSIQMSLKVLRVFDGGFEGVYNGDFK